MPDPSTLPDLTAVYARASKAVKGRQKSVRDQEAAGRARCAAQGWTVGGVYVDNDRSASTYARRGRPDWARLVDDLAERRFRRLWIWETSRGSRDLEEWAPLLGACRRLGVAVWVETHDRQYDLSVARDWKALADEGVDAQYESHKISARTRRGLESAAAAGRPGGGHVPYGHRRLYDAATGEFDRQVPDPDTAPIVAEICERVARRESRTSIANLLNRRGVPGPRGGVWTHESVRKVARNPAHIGRRVLHGQVHTARIQAVVAETVWYAAQRVMTERGAGRPNRARWLLSRLAVCDVCSAPLFARPAHAARVNAAGRVVPPYAAQYACPNGHVYMDVAAADAVVWATLPRVLARFPTDRLRADDAAVVAARRAVAELEAKLAAARESAATPGGISMASLAHLEARLGPQIAAARRRAVAAATPLALARLLDGAPTPEVIAARLADLPLAGQREILRLCATIRIARATRRAIQPERVLFSRWWGLD